jgi:cyanate permease
VGVGVPCRTDFVNDFVESRQDWISNKSNFFHHAFGIVLETLGMTIIPRRLDWLISAFFVLESSTVCLDIMWLLRAFGQEGSPLYKGSVTAFIALFTSLRVVMLPCFVQHLRKKHKKTWNDLGVFGKAGVYGVTGLQMYWFVKIIKRFILT